MAIFHDEEDQPDEPVRGLPAALPEGEKIVWQGGPDARALALHAFHLRFVAGYFVIFALVRAATAPDMQSALVAAAAMIAAGAGALFVLYLIAIAMTRAAVFTITNKRVVFRYGAAIRKYVNLPFQEIESVAIRPYKAGAGDIALSVSKKAAPPYFHLWPFARPLRINAPTPLMRALPDAGHVGHLLAATMKAARPETVRLSDTGAATPSRPTPAKAPAKGQAGAASGTPAAA